MEHEIKKMIGFTSVSGLPVYECSCGIHMFAWNKKRQLDFMMTGLSIQKVRKIMPKRNKAKSQRKHAELRSMERLGFIIDFDQAISDIRTQRAKFVERQSNRVTVWKLTQNDKEFYAIYDKIRKQIVTVMDFEPIY